MPPNRARQPVGMTAWSRGNPYGPGQFLPAGISTYTIEQWYSPTPEEAAAGATGRQQIVAVVSAAATREEIIDTMEALRQAKLDMRVWRDTPQTEEMLGIEGEPDELLDDMGFPALPGAAIAQDALPEEIPEGIPIAEFAPPLEEEIPVAELASPLEEEEELAPPPPPQGIIGRVISFIKGIFGFNQ